MGRNHQRDANPISVVIPRLLALVKKKKRKKKPNPESLLMALGQLFGWVNGGMPRHVLCSCQPVPVCAVLCLCKRVCKAVSGLGGCQPVQVPVSV